MYITDFGLSGDSRSSTKKGGTPVFASALVFGGNQHYVDSYSICRIILFMCLDYSDFLQLCFMPIEDEEKQLRIRRALESFEIFKLALGKMSFGGSVYFPDVSKCSKFLISRVDLIKAFVHEGISEEDANDWFIDTKGNIWNSVQDENWNLRLLK